MMTRETAGLRDARTTIRIAGRPLRVPSVTISGWPVVVTGRWLRLAQLKEEEVLEGDLDHAAATIITKLKASETAADLFAFAQKLPDGEPKHPYYFEWDNWAVVPITVFGAWWDKLPQESRKNVRRASKRGVTVQLAPFDGELVRGIQEIYDETPVRQGRRFWHFGKDFATIHGEMVTYLDRSDFLGAYLNRQLIGFIKLTYVDRVGMITQILAKNAYRDARPINALIARAVELCESKRMSFFVYGKYVYGRHTTSPLTEFKRRNGFEEFRVPRYFVPLTARGHVALKLGLHSSLRDRLPGGVTRSLLGLRSSCYRRFQRNES
jgi:hypothetical protein